MREDITSRKMPRIVVTEADHDRLTVLATAALDRMPELADVLLAELERAKVVTAKSAPPDVVRMGSTVEFKSDEAQARRVTLVFPGEANIEEGRVSILTPVGTALLGLSQGQSIMWTAPDGRRHQLTVLAVEQPAAAAA